MKLTLIVLIGLLSACVNDYQFKDVEPYFILHNNSSKVWVINHLYEGEKDLAPLSLKYKQVFVFHQSNTCYKYKMQHLGSTRGEKGNFQLSNQGKQLEIQFLKEIWRFEIKQLSTQKVVLSPLKNAPNKLTIELIPFPEY